MLDAFIDCFVGPFYRWMLIGGFSTGFFWGILFEEEMWRGVWRNWRSGHCGNKVIHHQLWNARGREEEGGEVRGGGGGCVHPTSGAGPSDVTFDLPFFLSVSGDLWLFWAGKNGGAFLIDLSIAIVLIDYFPTRRVSPLLQDSSRDSLRILGPCAVSFETIPIVESPGDSTRFIPMEIPIGFGYWIQVCNGPPVHHGM